LVKLYLFTAENAESAEMTKRENLGQIMESMIATAIEVHRALGPSGVGVGSLSDFWPNAA